ncbi:MAG TPA: hypothetical protein VJL61_00420 [Rhodanobacteraceae bacterium]|nr:hypothetical protein [Rhodanobacteraceae bacterium]
MNGPKEAYGQATSVLQPAQHEVRWRAVNPCFGFDESTGQGRIAIK